MANGNHVGFRAEPETEEWLEAVAAEADTSKSEVMRTIVRSYKEGDFEEVAALGLLGEQIPIQPQMALNQEILVQKVLENVEEPVREAANSAFDSGGAF